MNTSGRSREQTQDVALSQLMSEEVVNHCKGFCDCGLSWLITSDKSCPLFSSVADEQPS